MSAPRAWTTYAPTYRNPQLRTLAGWIAAGHSGSVVGMGGAGKSNLLGYLAHRPDVLERHLPDGAGAMAVWVDFNSLPATDLATVYRLLLRSFRDARASLDDELAAEIERVFAAHSAERDPFVVQTALLDWLARLTADGRQVALVVDRFDRFMVRATPELTDSLRALRDAHKGRLCFVMGMRQPVAYLPDPSMLGELQELLDTRICWVGPMTDDDARRMIAEEMAGATASPGEAAVTAMVETTGGYPALLKAACHAWLDGGCEQPLAAWADSLGDQSAIRSRMDEIWEGLTQAEQAALARIEQGATSEADDADAVALLAAKGLLEGNPGRGWQIRGRLLAQRAQGPDGDRNHRRGRLRLDEATREIHLGGAPLRDLTPLEHGALTYLLRRPRARIPKTELIEGVWPDDVVEDGVMDDALYQVVRGVRRKIEPEPGRPHYLVTWRGRPEGGYQLFPEGRPGR